MPDYHSIKTFEDACRATGKKPADVLHYTDTPDEEAYKKLKVIVAALNEGEGPNGNFFARDTFSPVFSELDTGFRYSHLSKSVILYYIPKHLTFFSPELATYCAEQFLDLWRAYLDIPQS